MYQLIESGEKNFTAAIKKYEELGEINKKYPHFQKFYDDNKFKKFLEALKYIQAEMNFKKAMDFMNHRNVEQVLNEGIRAYIAANMRSRGENQDAQEIEENSSCWGYIPNAEFLASSAKVDFSGFLIDGNDITFSSSIRDTTALTIKTDHIPHV